MNNENSTTKSRKFEFPDTYVIVIILILLVIALTYILPAGTYDFAEDGKTVLPGTYHYVEDNPAGIGEFLNSFFKGMQKGSTTIFLVFMIGGAFQILTDTGAIDAALAALIRKTKGNYKIIIPAVMIMMAILGALGTGNNVALAFAPIMVILCAKLKLDPIVVVATMYFAANSGFSASPINPFTVLLAQNIAGVQIMSGSGPRILMWFIFVTITIVWTMRYCKKIYKDPSKSLVGVYSEDDLDTDEDSALDAVAEKMSIRHTLNLLVLTITFIIYAWGGVKYDWGLPALGAAMMAMAFVTGIIGGLGPNKMANSFVRGAQKMVYSGLLIGFASAINVLMTESNIIHTVIHHLSMPLQNLPTYLATIGMYITNVLFNLVISSGSGLAYVVMPIMAPFSDLLGISRQVAISAYQFGDGLGNALVPTAGLLMGTRNCQSTL